LGILAGRYKHILKLEPSSIPHPEERIYCSHATGWIRQAASRAIAGQSRTIRIPVYRNEVASKLVRTARNLVQEYGRDPAHDGIAANMNIPASQIEAKGHGFSWY
jgi:DNA-directed RNA polymerase sigma subunit (sigma70/sigma32)